MPPENQISLFLVNIMGGQYKPVDNINTIIRICDKYKKILDAKREAAALDFTRELKVIMQSPELDPLIPEGISSPRWVELQENLDPLIAFYVKKVPDTHSIGVPREREGNVASTASTRDLSLTSADPIETKPKPKPEPKLELKSFLPETTHTRGVLDPSALENRDQPVSLARELTPTRPPTRSLVDHGQIPADGNAATARQARTMLLTVRNHIANTQKLEKLAIDLKGIHLLSTAEQKKPWRR